MLITATPWEEDPETSYAESWRLAGSFPPSVQRRLDAMAWGSPDTKGKRQVGTGKWLPTQAARLTTAAH